MERCRISCNACATAGDCPNFHDKYVPRNIMRVSVSRNIKIDEHKGIEIHKTIILEEMNK